MASKFKLDARLQSPGIFWNAEDPGSTFSGELQRADRRRIELASAPMPAGSDDFVRVFSGTVAPTPKELLGTIKSGPCTLLGLRATNGDSYIDMREPGASGFTTDKFLVSTCIVGLRLRNSMEPGLTSGQVTYGGLTGWVRAPREMTMGEDRVSFTYLKTTPLIDIAAGESGTRLVVESHYHCETRTSGFDTARSELSFTFEASEPQQFEWFWALAVRLESFLSACIGSSVTLGSMLLTDRNQETGWVVRSRFQKAEQPYPPAMIRCDAAQLATALETWLKDREKLEPFENLVYGRIRGSDMTVETEFLSLAQAIESLHRLTDDTTVVPRSEFETLRKAVAAAIAEHATGEIAARLKESIMFANEPSFRNRIESLLRRIPPDLVQKLLGEPKEFEQAVRQTRNYLTHLGGKAKVKVVSDPGTLFLLNQKLHAFLRLLVLVHLGFPAELVFDPIFQQSRRMAIV